MYFTCIIRFHCCVCFLSTDRLDRLTTHHILESKQNREKAKPLKANRRESHSAQLSLMLGYSSFIYIMDHVARNPPLLSLLTLCLVAIAMQNIQGPKMESTKHTHPERTGNIAQQHGWKVGICVDETPFERGEQMLCVYVCIMYVYTALVP